MKVLRVKHAERVLSLPLGADGSSVAELKKQLEALTHAPVDQQRLIVKGKVLADDAVVADDGRTAVLLVRPSADAIAAMNEQEAALKKLEETRASRPIVSIQAKNEVLSARAHAARAYRFHEIQTLPGLPDEARATAILTSLAQDKGILHVMAKHKWSVGALAEMYPDGKVGVDPVCVLGLNENKGQRILLRLRTDDLQGFRKYLTIKKVLYHELTHNDVSDHNNEFYQLMRQVEAECNTVPGTTTSLDAPTTSPTVAARGHVLGGSIPVAIEPRQLRVERALERFTALQSTPIEAAHHVTSPLSPAPASVSTPALVSTPAPASAPAPVSVPAPPTPLTRPWDLPTIELDTALLESLGEREQRVVSAAVALRARLVHEPRSQQSNVLRSLHAVLSNILQAPTNQLYRRLRKTNARIANYIIGVPPALELLHHIGFVDELPEHLVLQRDDPGLIWLGKSLLDPLVESIH
ncbi:hypothetical protein SPRG_09603 [Saprolegnia parasitica CBS 223.65]|uniref:WLM domain-containing protein n=1 Tax=Saprolegnia parasitica (strain CBS 223.65) TaxID=695850 RepID=A0A067C2E0_SAPPC|nr:hypothetical protein SPRG_09603 [Saprolegnia parasitica CBS 223.65]KDO24959.1 hypothetical protein SPRG_09603 [Saprolegnia parasitica CBS 223.65]|eukprot:XP_012204418.1 hypothetical protein SPRG_09603 [Saprolegnia parasitica CBS 223.65]